jgi:hypothetical protein
VWERGTLPEGGGMLPPEPGREPSGSEGRASPFSPRPLHTATYFLAGPAVTFSKYHASRLLRHLRRLDDANSFLLREHMLVSSYDD